jgi:hypothetical protein
MNYYSNKNINYEPPRHFVVSSVLVFLPLF